MVDYGAILFDPIYDLLGVEAMLTSSTAGIVEITVIDDTRAKSLSNGTMETQSIGPGAFARIYELKAKGIDRSDWIGSALAFNNQTWIIRSAEPRGSPNGEDLGEVRFALKAGT